MKEMPSPKQELDDQRGDDDGSLSRYLPSKLINVNEIELVVWFAFNLMFSLFGPDSATLTRSADLLPMRSTPTPIWPPRLIVEIMTYYGVYYSPWTLRRPQWALTMGTANLLISGAIHCYAVLTAVKNQELSPIIIMMSSFLTMFTTVVLVSAQLHSPHYALVILVNLPWILIPALIIIRFLSE